MRKVELADKLRQRQIEAGHVPRVLIEALTDDQIIAAYITCSCCGKQWVAPDHLDRAIALARDVEQFFVYIDTFRREIH